MTATTGTGARVEAATAGWGWAVLGAHGGAGTSTVVALLRGASGSPLDPYAAEQVVELRAGQPLPASAVPVLVTRSTAHGLAAAARALGAWHPGVPRPWLVVVADAPAPPPLPVRYRIRALGGQTRGAVTVPYLWPLRAADHPAAVATTRPFTRAAARLRAALLVEETR